MNAKQRLAEAERADKGKRIKWGWFDTLMLALVMLAFALASYLAVLDR
jgi:hypothetical protein